ncbi:branched-chain amino acid ABC transporter substrate-binding protein [Methylobacterium sp. NEAU 140]|uniref:branched-chain amino acid ABC transporter substrate-binding protein n=1 Tax=Methylobacterium sp. NEAU 140 TaxID=3064945 RepID=UPI002737752B|nr:branched-chain amino acid ABC transporter substrate-binding protein [Methylobacterium sp. NEAU 140]MDP4025719.1 branched-chain amino acid ABC transporter substrate-binding protein [Methylobacterium sp. NEAU 140]
MRPAALLAALLLATPAAAQAPVRIGLSAPLTGPDAAYGQGLRLGAEQAVADLNRAGGGRRYALVTADDAGEARQAAAVAKRFAGEGIRLVVGPLESSSVAAASPVYDEAGAVAITPGAAYGPLTGRGLGTLFRLAASDAQQGRAAGAYLARAFAGRPIGIVHDRSTFGRGLAEAVSARLRQAGAHEAVFEGFDRGSRDLGDLVGRLKAAGVAAVYVGALAPEAASLARALREAGSGAVLVASDGVLDPVFAAGAGSAGEGTVMTLPADPPRLPETRGGRAAPRTPEGESVAAAAYAAVELLAQAAERARAVEARTGRVDGRKVAEALRGAPLRTLLGPVSFDARGDQVGEPVTLRVWRRGADGRLDYAGNEPAL